MVFSYFVIYLQDQAAGKGKLENTLRTKNLAGLETRQEAELLSQTHLALLSNALSLIVGESATHSRQELESIVSQ